MITTQRAKSTTQGEHDVTVGGRMIAIPGVDT